MTTPVVVFDLDDTLYLERDFVRSGFAAVEAWLAVQHGVCDFQAHAWELFLAGRRGDVFDGALPMVGLEPRPALIERLVEIYREHRPTIGLEPAASDLLAALSGRCRLALLTDGYHDTQRRKVAALALEVWCDPVVCTDQGAAHTGNRARAASCTFNARARPCPSAASMLPTIPQRTSGRPRRWDGAPCGCVTRRASMPEPMPPRRSTRRTVP